MSSPSAFLSSEGIAEVLSSSGPTVKAVLLRASNDSKDDGDKKAPSSETENDVENNSELVDQVSVDTTPSKSMVAKMLGGPFTFLGQYEDEGIVLMVRRQSQEDEDKSSPSLPVNPHRLQPPLDKEEVRGDILIVKVAAVDEAEEQVDETALSVTSNDDFFQDYTREEYLEFAARTDIVSPVASIPEEEEEEEQGQEDDEEEEDEDSDGDGDEEDEDEAFVLDGEEEKTAMLNVVMAEILRRFRQDNGRGPNSEEVLRIRAEVARQLDVELEPPLTADESTVRPKRKLENNAEEKVTKKVKFEELPARATTVSEGATAADNNP